MTSDNQGGFTLIELLVVIAIIAVLVLVVVVTINPAQRIRDAENQRAASNVRAAGGLLSLCVTKELVQTPPNPIEPCGDPADSSVRDQYGNFPGTTQVAQGDDGDDDEVCAAEQGSGGAVLGRYYVFRSSTGELDENNGVMPAPDVWCPGVS